MQEEAHTEILIADILKSLCIYKIHWEKEEEGDGDEWDETMGNCRSYSMYYRFPFGQWCTGMVKIDHEVYAASFFDQNFAVIKGETDPENEG